jgi:hypothetical protein
MRTSRAQVRPGPRPRRRGHGGLATRELLDALQLRPTTGAWLGHT